MPLIFLVRSTNNTSIYEVDNNTSLYLVQNTISNNIIL